MAVFEIQAPDGSLYQVEAPDEAAAVSGFKQFTAQAAPPAPTAKPGYASDIVHSAGSGILKGAIGLMGLPGDLARVVGNVADWGAEKITGEKLPQSFKENAPANSVGSARLRKDFEGLTGPLYEPQTLPGKIAGTVGEFVPAAGGGVANTLRYAVAPGVASELAGQATEGSKLEGPARIAGALAGMAAPALAKRLITPLPTPPARQAAVATMQREGIELTAGQRTGSKPLQWVESVLGDMPLTGGGPEAIARRQGEQFTAAALRRAGTDAPLATPEVMKQTSARIGQQFSDLSARNTLIGDTSFGRDIGKVLNNYDVVLSSEQSAKVGRLTDDIIEKLTNGGGKMAGQDYQAARSRLSRLAQNNKLADPDFAEAVRGLRNALDNAMGRSIKPAEKALWEQAREQYGALKTIQKAAAGAGEKAAEGYISPSQLRSAVAANDRVAYAEGRGNLADLARSAEVTMRPLPNSGTAPRQYMQGLITAMSGAAGGAATGLNPAAVAAGIAAPSLAGRALMSRPVQSYLGNQLLTPAPRRAGESLVQMLLAGRTATSPTTPR